MITRFDSLFAGHVDMDRLGLDGTPVNERRFTNRYLATVFDKAKAIAQLMDRTGFHTFWMAEHHFQHEGYECIPNILSLSIHLAHLTKRVNFGCGFNITPMWHPLRLAEDFAAADIMTRGRVVFGVGRGYHSREVETFGAPVLDNSANREMFEEQVEIVLRAFSEKSFSYHGKYYDIPGRVPYRSYELEEITLVPRPVRRPVECWQPIVSASQQALDFMAAHDIKGVIGGGAAPVAPRGATGNVVHAWRRTLARHGRDTELGGDLIFGLYFHIAETEEKALQEARKLFEEHVKFFSPLGFIRGITPEQIEAAADPGRAPFAGLPSLEDAVRAGAWLCGPPELIIEKLMALESAYPGLEEINLGNVIGTPRKIILEQLEWLATDVMPEFTGRSASPPPEGQLRSSPQRL